MIYPLDANKGFSDSLGDLLGQVSDFLLTMTRGALEKPSDEFKDWVLSELRLLISFDSGVWAMGSWINEQPVVHSAHLYRIKEGFVESWLQHQQEDKLIRLITVHCNKSFNVDVKKEYGGTAIYNMHCRNFGVEHILATGVVNPDTRILNTLVLYRADINRPFTELERSLKELIFSHLVEAARTNWLANLPNMLSARQHSCFNALAACDASGLLQVAMPSFVDLCRKEWPGWAGPFLPQDVVANLEDDSRSYLGKNIAFGKVKMGDIFLLRSREKVGADSLTEREWQIAQKIAQGDDYKTIAQSTGISPATVRTHVNNIFTKLDINDKARLATELGRIENFGL